MAPSRPVRAHLFRLVAVALASTLAGCAAETEDASSSETDALVARADDAWFYTGPLPTLQNPSVTISIAGHTARVTGYLPPGVEVPPLPHVRQKVESGRTRLDVVYPIATARPGKTNARPGTHAFSMAKPYRPDGSAVTREEGEHFVPWGGFPFLNYNDGIAFHGPITSELSRTGDLTVWLLKRGTVSGGCNRMQGENVVEMAHLLGVNMRKVYAANQVVRPPSRPVTVLAEYDSYEGKLVDVDYPTDVGVTRPAKVHGADKVEMFGSWVALELPTGQDLPADLKWSGGVRGAWYVHRDHALPNMVCSFPSAVLPGLKGLSGVFGGELPKTICEKKACVVEALSANRDAKAACGL